ncbi:MAG TPA: hypothetical protein VFH22_01845 [Rhodocyclaceae bacterium]|nr:hypothetical protein [Rhodocyclaceae bacterium]
MRDTPKIWPFSDLDDDLEVFAITAAGIAAVCVLAFELARAWLW